MKNYWSAFRKHFISFFDGPKKPHAINLKQNQLTKTLQDAIQSQSAVHVIYSQKSFTGDIIRYDKETGQLVLKNFQQNISAIIAFSDIDRISLVPDTVKQSQAKAQ
ncbi:hypothetical protein [Streptococcus loxodontisalivarius]|uniref:ABC-type branched-subunit amino acid transport system substrate-binding protein n=1 Tax=Streptococcus loxodontisalivarius TaxID=1349415 RepID=A0ABS2PTY6_9STRE|nr:hypothetical protein [Streptococcus loxodontisalivarius]MBM7643005.1 ABC-type branched-subunit amino acid transport system substrate-binding protein [Streptococcus loxodontisalivarius]